MLNYFIIYKKNIINTLIFSVIILLISCDQTSLPPYSPEFSDSPPKDKITEYSFAVHPLHNPQRLFEVFSPLMQYLSNNIPEAKFRLESSRDYRSFEQKLYAGELDFALPNPHQTIIAADKGYKVFAKMSDDFNFRGIILVRKDSGITKTGDLIDKSVAYPAPTALAATMMPQYYLQSHGINVTTDINNVYVGSQESSIMSVYLGETAAAATWPPPWLALSKERPELVEQLKVIWQTEPLLNNGLVVLPKVSQAVVDQVTLLLINLHRSQEGKAILARMGLSKFELANNDTYEPVRRFIDSFIKEVRSIK